MESAETGERTSDLRTATIEDGEGKAFQFKTELRLRGRKRRPSKGKPSVAATRASPCA